MTFRDPRPAMHMITPFHTVPSLTASHCAFTGKALRFAKMMRGFFSTYFEYGNEGSESVADEKIVILRQKEMEKFYPRKKTDFWGNHAVCTSKGWQTFDARLRVALAGRIRPGDFVAHPFGRAHAGIVTDYPQAIHVETGIGYPDGPFGAYRVYESWAWAHSHWGRWGEAGLGGECPGGGAGLDRTYSWVIPNYFDLEEWPLVEVSSRNRTPYILFMGRVDTCKGIDVLATIIRAWCEKHGTGKLHFVVAGQGDWSPFAAILKKQAAAVKYIGPVVGTKRAELCGNALATIMPTKFVEPFGGSGVEGQLCGAPLLASAWGAFTETVTPGANGYQCRTLGDWIQALEFVLEGRLSARQDIATAARARYSLEACRPKYARVFGSLMELRSGRGILSTTPTLWDRP
jgi:glycosyltransferase involved in cell wall biosynthesis